jgi:hypothetical protein
MVDPVDPSNIIVAVLLPLKFHICCSTEVLNRKSSPSHLAVFGRPVAPAADRVFGPPEDPRMYQLIEETLGTEMHGVTERKLQVPTGIYWMWATQE